MTELVNNICKSYKISEAYATRIVNKLAKDADLFKEFSTYISSKEFHTLDSRQVDFNGITVEKLVNEYKFQIIDAYICLKKLKEGKIYQRTISNGIRFGSGFRYYMNGWQFFAWYGLPNRNDDYITTTSISEDEYIQICIDYPNSICADLEFANHFHSMYIENHTVILEGWNNLLK